MPQEPHKASARDRHCCRYAACLVMESHVQLHAFVSFLIVLCVSLGQPCLLQPFVVQRRAVFVLSSAPRDIRHTCPSHLHIRLFICVANYVVFVLRRSSSLAFGQNSLRIFWRHIFQKVSSLFACLAVSFEHS